MRQQSGNDRVWNSAIRGFGRIRYFWPEEEST